MIHLLKGSSPERVIQRDRIKKMKKMMIFPMIFQENSFQDLCSDFKLFFRSITIYLHRQIKTKHT